MNGLTIKFGSTALKRALILGVIGALMTSFMVAQAVATTNLGTSNVKLATEAFTDDTDVSVAALGTGVIQSNASALGTSPAGEEITSGLPPVRNAHSRNNYFYKFEVKGTGNTTLGSAENLKIEVYGDDGSTTTLLATLYTQQVTLEGSAIEGVTATVDVGTVLHNNYDIIVSRQ